MSPTTEVHATEDRFSREVLEFPAVLELLRGYLSGPLSVPLLASVEPHTRLDLIRRQLEQAKEAREHLRQSPRPNLEKRSGTLSGKVIGWRGGRLRAHG